MKFINKKSSICALALVIIIAGISVLQSCSNNNDDIALNSAKNISIIPISDIPKNIKPIIVASDDEMNKIIKQLEELSIVDSKNRTKGLNGQLNYDKLYVKTEIHNLQENKVRFKADTNEATNSDSWYYDIIVSATYPELNSSTITISSRVTNFAVGYFDWHQTNASGWNWQHENGQWWLSGNVTGDLSCYFVNYANGSKSFLWQKTKSFNSCIICN